MPAPSNRYQTRSVRVNQADHQEDPLSVNQEEILEALVRDETEEMAQRVTLATFNGDQSERGDIWFGYFDKYASLHSYSEEKQLDLLPFFLGKHARVWYDSLDDRRRTNLADLKAAFIARFTESNRDMDMYSLSQNLGESSADYFTRCQQAMVGKNCPENIQVMTVIRGLLPALQQHVLLKAPKTMEETREAMLLTEMASQRFGPQTTPVSQLTTSVETSQCLYQAVKDLTASVNTLQLKADTPASQPRWNHQRDRATRGNHRGQGREPYRPRSEPEDQSTQARRCGSCNGIHAFNKCNAKHNQCSKCSYWGHFSDLCKNKKAQNRQ